MEFVNECSTNKINEQFIYRGEGNSSIVIAFKDKARVIRLLKKDGKIMKSSLDHHVSQHPMRSIKFIHLIMKPLTEPYLSSSTDLVHLKSDFINLISKRVEAERPRHRLDKTLHLDDQFALVMDDLCTLPAHIMKKLHHKSDLVGPTISVEIKPKQGFMPNDGFVIESSANNRSIHSYFAKSCLYGSTQALKLNRGRIRETSSYCPINLFSGCPIKMRSALEGLLRNPQNNFRIFKDKILAYDEGNQMKLSNLLYDFFDHDRSRQVPVDYERQLIDILIQCLLNESPVKISSDKPGSDLPPASLGSEGDENVCSINVDSRLCFRHSQLSSCKRCDNQTIKRRKTSINLVGDSHKLPPTCVLASVLRAQKLDTIGAFGARKMLDWLLKNSKSEDILEQLSKPNIPTGFGTAFRLETETREQYNFRKVWEFLVSLTAKDCSIIITLRRICPGRYDDILSRHPNLRGNTMSDNMTGGHYIFNVGITDLDQKMPLKIYRICENLIQTFELNS